MATEETYGPNDARWDLDHVRNRVNNIVTRARLSGDRYLAAMVQGLSNHIDMVIEECDKLSSKT